MAKKENINFQQRLILNKYLLNIIGFDKFEEIQLEFKSPELEKTNIEGQTKFITKLINDFSSRISISKEDLLEYDNNIINALNKINYKREEKINLKYFQYFSLLFVEIYLDNYFSDKKYFLDKLNTYLSYYNKKNKDNLSSFKESDLNKLALWSATGSGKTILMQLNFYQISYYINKYKHNFDGTYLLLTPNEGLSQQHLKEFNNNGIKAEIYNKSNSSTIGYRPSIEIIENTKFSEKDGDKTVAVSRFGNSNILFVDEGHRGTSGDSWYRFRNELCYNGFSFEYSATFGQAIKASNKKNLEDEYSKCIYFDYSYKHFYNDGFGKDYQILNLPDDQEDTVNLYLTAFLLTFYQQKKLFNSNQFEYKDFNISNPLMVFVGGSVNAVKTKDKKQVSDVLEILLFIQDFISNKIKYVQLIYRILNEKTGLLNNNIDVFSGSFNYINNLNLSAEEIYSDVILNIFNSSITGARLYIEYLKGSDGEIKLTLGENKPFGLISVGDATKLINLCNDNNLSASTTDFSESLFYNINDKNSSINILIGSKKFSEGWNSWRVSSMGLINMGKNEGSQIIQLFGRGVRLKGKNMSLKRSSAYFTDYPFEKTPNNYKYLKYLETINVFGIKANYMLQFKEYLEDEGLNLNEKSFTIEIPIIKNVPPNKIITLMIKDNLNFKRDGIFILPLDEDDKFIIELDCYGRIQFQSSRKKIGSIIEKEIHYFTDLHLKLIDYDNIYFEIQKYKGEKNYYNIVITKEIIKNLLKNRKWYKLLIPSEDMEIRTMEDIPRFERIAISLLKKYLDKKYTVSKSKWESPLLEYNYIDNNDNNFINTTLYNIEITDKEINSLYIKFFENIKEKITNSIKENSIMDIRNTAGNIGCISLKESLYNPYIYSSKENMNIKITPAALNNSEWVFIKDLRNYLSINKSKFIDKNIYLIRNQSKKGVGFFEDNGFYPDFILWIVDKNNSYMTFIEPHGMRNEDINSEKVTLYKRLKEFEKNIDKSRINNSTIPTLNSFILSPTKELEMVAKYTENDWNKNHVLFMDSDDYIDKMFRKILNNI